MTAALEKSSAAARRGVMRDRLHEAGRSPGGPCLAVRPAVRVAGAEDWPHWRARSRNDITSEDSRWRRAPGAGRSRVDAERRPGRSSPIVVAIASTRWVGGRTGHRLLPRCRQRRAGVAAILPAPSMGATTRGMRTSMTASCPRRGTTPPPGGLHAGYNGTSTAGTRGSLAESGVAWGPDPVTLPASTCASAPRRRGDTGLRLHESPLVYGDGWCSRDDGDVMAFDKGRQRGGAPSRGRAGHTGGFVPMVVEGLPCLASSRCMDCSSPGSIRP